ncbi:hypothetical protein V502_02933 [Pseudogymnoascus sp. VKM F-4520 (FW-2644)]|nr:hypothetical protein V502_02933 [Pseudogymnoascus sp. VKM F-4520 (FW-2644)]
MEENSSPRTSFLEERLSFQPQIDGAVNFREFGGYASNLFPGARTRKGFIYRSGYLQNITPQGWTKIHQLHISTIIQLTTLEEANSLYPKQIPVSDGLQTLKIIKLPFLQNTFSLKDLQDKYSRQLANGPWATAQTYFDMLQEGPHIIRTILLQIRDHPDEAFAQEAIKTSEEAMSLTFQKVEQAFGGILQLLSYGRFHPPRLRAHPLESTGLED